MTTISKVDENTVVEIGTQEVRKIYSKEELEKKKQRLEATLAQMNALLAVFSS